jgi:hypothetical protein
MGKLTLEAYEKQFMELLRYVPYLKDKKERIQHFLSGFPQSYQDQIEFNKPKTLEDTIQRLNVVTMSLSTSMSLLRIGKERTRVDSRRKDSSPFPHKNYRKDAQSGQPSRSVHQQKKIHPKVGISQ